MVVTGSENEEIISIFRNNLGEYVSSVEFYLEGGYSNKPSYQIEISNSRYFCFFVKLIDNKIKVSESLGSGHNIVFTMFRELDIVENIRLYSTYIENFISLTKEYYHLGKKLDRFVESSDNIYRDLKRDVIINKIIKD